MEVGTLFSPHNATSMSMYTESSMCFCDIAQDAVSCPPDIIIHAHKIIYDIRKMHNTLYVDNDLMISSTSVSKTHVAKMPSFTRYLSSRGMPSLLSVFMKPRIPRMAASSFMYIITTLSIDFYLNGSHVLFIIFLVAQSIIVRD